MHSAIHDLSSQYGLSKAEVIHEAESAFSVLLSRWYGREVLAFLQDETHLEVVAYDQRNGIPVQQILDLPAALSLRQCSAFLEERLALAAVVRQTRPYKSSSRSLLWGEVMRNHPGSDLFIETEIHEGEPLIALCPLNRVGIHQRESNRLQCGQRRAFHLRLVDAVLVNGMPRTKVVLDRVSKTLTENLLRHYLGLAAGQYQFRCLKRYVGHKSLVLSTKRLPREAIKAVDRELQERIEVRIVKALP